MSFLMCSILFTIIFAGSRFVLFLGLGIEALREKRRRTSSPRTEPLPSVSVVIPARDEEARLGPLLRSLTDQHYPDFEIIFINDRSSDATAAMLEDFARHRKSGRTEIVTLTDNPGPNFKQFALIRGIERARGDLILFTDADCAIGPDWVPTMAAAIASQDVGLVIAPVFKPVVDGRFFSYFQAFDHAVRFAYLASSVGLGMPTGGFGNNLIVRRAALDAIGGYAAVPPSPTEDAALIATIRSKTGYRVRACLSPAAFVVTAAEQSFRRMLIQGLRWNNGGLFADDIMTRAGFGALMFGITASVLMLFAAPFSAEAALAASAVYMVITMDALSALAIARSALPRPPIRLLAAWFLEPPYFALLTILGLLRIEVRWKGERIGA